jgi:aminopeptidase N
MPTETTPLRRDEAIERARLLSDVTYSVQLDLTGEDDRTYASVTTITFSCVEPGAASFLDLLADEVIGVELNGKPVAAKAVAGARIALEDLAGQNTCVVEARMPYMHNGTGLHRFVDPTDQAVYLHTQFEPFDAHRVYACFDQPDLKAPFALTVTAPAEWTCISNGRVAGRADTPDGAATRWTFAEYLTALVAGHFHVERDAHGDVELGLYCRRSLAEHIDREDMFEVTKQGLDFFAEAFGTPYPFGKYDQLFVPEFNFGAMENPGCVTFSESYVFRSRVTWAAYRSRANTTLHEMAHMWFGDLVTMRWWDDLWLNESFATYTAYLAEAEATRYTDAWSEFQSEIKAWAYQQDQLPSTHPIAADMTDTEDVRTNFDGITYAKGASVLKQLVAYVGRDGFLAGLQRYFPRHAWGNATLADFLAALEEGSGRDDLGAWSKEWLETAGLNTLRADVTRAEDGTYTEVAVLQSAPEEHPHLRTHRLAIGLYDLGDEGLVRRHRVELDVQGERTVVEELAGQREADLLLVNDDDLAYAKVRLGERSVATLQAGLGRIRDPLARAICWGATWDMTRDGELAARRFVTLVAEHAAGEEDAGLLQTILRQAGAAADRYGAPENRERARRWLADAAAASLATAAAGSDTQLLWVRAFAGLADGEDHLDRVRALLDGEAELEGLEVDTELRWQLLTNLARAGRAGEDEIAAEEERDPTDIGKRRAATARAVRPSVEAKAAAWNAVLDAEELPLAVIRAHVGGIFVPGQDDLLRPYVRQLPKALARTWRDRDVEEALSITGGLYPSSIVEPEVVEVADGLLADESLPKAAKRVVSESRDATLRALRAREVDAAVG